jgi:hypothetical protein
LRSGVRSLRQRAQNGAAREIDFEGIVGEAFGIAEQNFSRSCKGIRFGRLAAQCRFGLRVTPGLCATPPSARRASLIRPPSSSNAAATDTNANA